MRGVVYNIQTNGHSARRDEINRRLLLPLRHVARLAVLVRLWLLPEARVTHVRPLRGKVGEKGAVFHSRTHPGNVPFDFSSSLSSSSHQMTAKVKHHSPGWLRRGAVLQASSLRLEIYVPKKYHLLLLLPSAAYFVFSPVKSL